MCCASPTPAIENNENWWRISPAPRVKPFPQTFFVRTISPPKNLLRILRQNLRRPQLRICQSDHALCCRPKGPGAGGDGWMARWMVDVSGWWHGSGNFGRFSPKCHEKTRMIWWTFTTFQLASWCAGFRPQALFVSRKHSWKSHPESRTLFFHTSEPFHFLRVSTSPRKPPKNE